MELLNKDCEQLQSESAKDDVEVIKKLSDSKFDILVLNLRLEENNGYEIFAKSQMIYPKIKAIVFSYHLSQNEITFLTKAGVSGLITKNAELEEFKTAINIVNHGGFYIHKELRKNRTTSVPSNSIDEITINTTSELTEREKEITKLICQQLTSKEIAEKLFISELTVNNHKAKISKKLNIKNSIGIAIYAIKSQLF